MATVAELLSFALTFLDGNHNPLSQLPTDTPAVKIALNKPESLFYFDETSNTFVANTEVMKQIIAAGVPQTDIDTLTTKLHAVLSKGKKQNKIQTFAQELSRFMKQHAQKVLLEPQMEATSEISGHLDLSPGQPKAHHGRTTLVTRPTALAQQAHHYIPSGIFTQNSRFNFPSFTREQVRIFTAHFQRVDVRRMDMDAATGCLLGILRVIRQQPELIAVINRTELEPYESDITLLFRNQKSRLDLGRIHEILEIVQRTLSLLTEKQIKSVSVRSKHMVLFRPGRLNPDKNLVLVTSQDFIKAEQAPRDKVGIALPNLLLLLALLRLKHLLNDTELCDAIGKLIKEIANQPAQEAHHAVGDKLNQFIKQLRQQLFGSKENSNRETNVKICQLLAVLDWLNTVSAFFDEENIFPEVTYHCGSFSLTDVKKDKTPEVAAMITAASIQFYSYVLHLFKQRVSQSQVISENQTFNISAILRTITEIAKASITKSTLQEEIRAISQGHAKKLQDAVSRSRGNTQPVFMGLTMIRGLINSAESKTGVRVAANQSHFDELFGSEIFVNTLVRATETLSISPPETLKEMLDELVHLVDSLPLEIEGVSETAYQFAAS